MLSFLSCYSFWKENTSLELMYWFTTVNLFKRKKSKFWILAFLSEIIWPSPWCNLFLKHLNKNCDKITSWCLNKSYHAQNQQEAKYLRIFVSFSFYICLTVAFIEIFLIFLWFCFFFRPFFTARSNFNEISDVPKVISISFCVFF